MIFKKKCFKKFGHLYYIFLKFAQFYITNYFSMKIHDNILVFD